MLRAARAMLLLTVTLVLAACGDDNDGGGGDNSCSLAAGPSTISGTASYSASATGNGTISQIRYQGASGQLTVNNPTLPWNIVEDLDGAMAQVEATGTVSSGSLTIAYSVTPPGGGALQEGDDSCSR